MQKPVSLLIATFFAAASLQAQEVQLAPTVLASAGGYAVGDHISISWTLGELAVSTLSSGNLILTQGFQQPFDINVGIRNNEVNWGIYVYPNPVGNELRIRFDTDAAGDYLIEIQDVTGRLISQQEYKNLDPGDIVVLNTSAYLNGVYFLKVLTPDRQQVQVTSLRKL